MKIDRHLAKFGARI